MNIQLDNPVITYSQKGKPFLYDKLFIKTFADYIKEYKNVEYERLTEKDQSIALARIIKKMECNGVSVTDFFSAELEKWSELENHEKIAKLIEIISKDMFCCFDKNLEKDGEFAKCDRIYCVNNDGKRDYVAYQEPQKKGLFAKAKAKSPYHTYFAELIEKSEAGLLPKSSQE